MRNKEKIFIHENKKVNDAIVSINDNGYQSVLVIDDDMHLKGMVTDGDIRRWILDKKDLDESITRIMNPNPRYVKEGYSRTEATKLMAEKILHILPVLDNDHRVVEIIHYVDLLKNVQYDTPVVIMAGGLGSRLKEKTKDCPKPLLKIGSKPILETIIENFKDQGFSNFYLTVNYKSEQIEEYFKDGSWLGVSIRYIREEKRMGTAGSLSLLPENIIYPILVMNGDILTKTDFVEMLKSFNENQSTATIGVREYTEEIPYGVVEINEKMCVERIQEKPINSYLVSAGFYVLGKEAVRLIPKNIFYDMPSLLDKLISEKRVINTFQVRDYWIDIGRLEDFRKAEIEYETFF